jgi:hypothetical protein
MTLAWEGEKVTLQFDSSKNSAYAIDAASRQIPSPFPSNPRGCKLSHYDGIGGLGCKSRGWKGLSMLLNTEPVRKEMAKLNVCEIKENKFSCRGRFRNWD